MFTQLDKALVALVMSILSILNLVFGINFGMDPAVISSIIAALTPVLVYWIPNKSKSPSQ